MAQDDRTELELLRDIERWTRLAALPGLRARAQEVLDTDSKKRAYAAMDGVTLGIETPPPKTARAKKARS